MARDHDGRPQLLLEDIVHGRVLETIERVAHELGSGRRLVEQARYRIEQHHTHHPPGVAALAVAPCELRHVGRAERVARHDGALHAVPAERRVEQRGEAVGRGRRGGEDALAEGGDVEHQQRRRVVGALVEECGVRRGPEPDAVHEDERVARGRARLRRPVPVVELALALLREAEARHGVRRVDLLPDAVAHGVVGEGPRPPLHRAGLRAHAVDARGGGKARTRRALEQRGVHQRRARGCLQLAHHALQLRVLLRTEVLARRGEHAPRQPRAHVAHAELRVGHARRRIRLAGRPRVGAGGGKQTHARRGPVGEQLNR
mmetsp:Transcript_8784/g.21753  ORF Transcript_8784/g.21753 Transcript_8784/m.21753 type:complete len:317 (+) Transcript_8784:659-1609(+)